MSQAQLLETRRLRRRNVVAREQANDERSQPIWFGEASAELFGLYHAPLARSRGMGIVLCNPFGYEAMCTHRAYLHLAQRLAARGFAVLRFDYHGTGDSSGDDSDPERWSAWVRSARVAIAELRARSGCEQVGLFGCRLGANLALSAAAERDDVRALALWGPAYSGRAFLREELAVHKLRALPDQQTTQGSVDGQLEALGFVLSAETLVALGAHQIAQITGVRAQSVLLLGRDAALDDRRIASSLSGLGLDVMCAAGGGYADMVQDNLTPDETWGRVVDYFEGHAPAAPLRRVAERRDVVSTSAEVWDAVAAREPARETAGYFGPEGRLFGVLTHGDPIKSSAGEPVVLLLSGGVNHHVGQNRMYTRWARAWAREGITSLRFDLAGFGDSVSAPGVGEGELHALASVADVQAAMDYVTERTASESFVIIGLCSGAFMAFHTALCDVRVVGLGLLNWTHFYSRAERPQAVAERNVERAARVDSDRRYHALRYYVQRLGRRSTWERVWRREVDAPGIATHLLARLAARARSEWRQVAAVVSGRRVAPTQLAADFARLIERDVNISIVYNGDEPVIDALSEQLGPRLRRFIRRGQLRLDLLDGTDHVFTPVWSQRKVFAMMTRLLLQL